MRKTFGFLFIGSLFLAVGCNNNNTSNTGPENTTEPPIPTLTYSIVRTLPHDTSYFIEGAEFYNNTLLESTGNYGPSKLLQIAFPSNKIINKVDLGPKYFGEGITVLHDTLYQLTYKEGKVFVYNAKDFKKINELPFNGEGWGMTNDGKNLIVTNGSANLYFYEPGTFRLLKVQQVTENRSLVPNINELEYVNGFVYANQWTYNYIYKIDPTNGAVVAKLDLTDLVNQVKARYPEVDVLNGIAYDPATKKMYVTGKYWPEWYEIQFER
jgi:glutaminyl-peptide cyclotransferase